MLKDNEENQRLFAGKRAKNGNTWMDSVIGLAHTSGAASFFSSIISGNKDLLERYVTAATIHQVRPSVDTGGGEG